MDKEKSIEKVTSLNNIKGNFYTTESSYDIAYKNQEEIVSELKKYSSDFDFCQFVNQADGEGLNQLYIDINLNKQIKFSTDRGRDFDTEDFNINYNEEIIPIIISKRLEEKYPLNSEFKDINTSFTNEINYFNGGATFKVVGILDDSSSFWLNDEVLLDKLNYFDVIVYPTNFNNMLDFNPPCYFINLNSSIDKYDEIKRELEAIYPNISFNDSSLKDSFVKKLNDKIIELIFINVFTLILLVLSLFGFISIIQSINLLRKKEIGIYYCLGATTSNIIAFVLGEIFIISFSSMFLCYLLVDKLSNYLFINYEILFNSTTIIVSGIVILCYILIAAIIAVKTILKKEPLDLIRN
ncbi:ABC transporter permease [Clostridium sp. DSM 8431]|uniref:ABC transporter permease n=1 Tax=Clostridium sp. DSM 8431 TaxID=1761781 RepID=UPI0015875252|nr:ABC transporter permease [Clostridium sp. DSM 8431]